MRLLILFFYLFFSTFSSAEVTENKQDYVIITDNHLASQFPTEIPLIIVHHGVARVHLERERDWDLKWKNLCVYGQDMIFHTRNTYNTINKSLYGIFSPIGGFSKTAPSGLAAVMTAAMLILVLILVYFVR